MSTDIGNLYCLSSYVRVLATAKAEGYAFVTFEQYDPSGGKQIILRHDIDSLPSLALKMAEVDAEQGIKSTFCAMVDSALYNVLSQEDSTHLRHIVSLGHELGVHLDASRWGSDEDGVDDIGSWIKYACGILHTEGLHHPHVVSWHSPTQRWLAEVVDWHPRGMLNAMHRRFFKDGIAYLSDSNCRYTPSQLCELLSQGTEHIQLLLHPLIWVVGGWTMRAILARFWRHQVRDRERFMIRTNQVYRGDLPNGMSVGAMDALDRFCLYLETDMEQGGIR